MPAEFSCEPLTGSQIALPQSPYIGPGDLVPALAWYSVARAYSGAAAAAGVLAVRVLDVSQGTNTYDLPIKSNGQIDLSQLAGITGHTFNVIILYDQTGNGNHMNTQILASFPRFVLNSIAGFPVIDVNVNPNNSGLTDTTFSGPSQPYSVSCVFKTLAGEGFGVAFGQAANQGLNTRGTANVMGVESASGGAVTNITASDNFAHSLNYRMNNPTDATYVLDGGAPAALTNNTDTNAWTGGAISVGAGFSQIAECGVFASAVNLSAIDANQSAFYGAFPQ